MGKTAKPATEQPGPRKLKVHSLTGQFTLDLLERSFMRVKQNKGAAGIDRTTIPVFESNLRVNLTRIRKEVADRTYQPAPLRRVYVPKPNGKSRPLGIPTIRDRTVQEAIRRLLEPIFEPTFNDNSFGFRPGRSCHDALQRIKQYHRQGYRWVVDADITGCFDNIPHKVIMQTLAWEVADGNILTAVERSLTAGIMEDKELKPTNMGTPQGGPLSPLLANIVLNRMDWQLAHAGYRFVRYADDFVILCHTKHDAEKALNFVGIILAKLGLELSEEKTRISSFKEGWDFLGFHCSPRHITMREKAVERFKDNVRMLTVRKHNLDKCAIERLNAVIRGTANYFGHRLAATSTQFRYLDILVRKRVRCMKKKRIWHTDNYRLPNKMLKRWGILSLVEIRHAARAPPVP